MKKKLLSIIILFLIIGSAIKFGGLEFFKPSTARAVGDLNVNWGVPDGQPIFTVNNFLPGDSEARTVQIINGAGLVRPVGVKGKRVTELKDLADVLDFRISEGGTDLYGGTTGAKTLADFFNESEGIDGIELFSVNPGQTRTINFTVKFPESSGNDFQNANIVFDIIIGIAVEVPQECRNIHFSGNPIFGTQGRDVIRGTNGNDLIFAFEGDDVVNGSNGDDCVVGGPGNDTINNSNGNDVIFGNEGNDRLNGSNGNDIILGGSGNDTIKGSNGNDQINGNEGNDDVDGSNGNDVILGNEGNDTLRGGNGNDTLLGGLGNDSARGDLGTDTCEAESKTTCEL
ncbi:MAG: calcium-binding protein [Candidatus Levybacteria bacterium]|nr:calcium-binding protein [Candidatus Levybacteria bacterium]